MQQVIGDGNSQSACRLTAFVNDHPQQATAHDAFIIHAGVGRTTSYPARGLRRELAGRGASLLPHPPAVDDEALKAQARAAPVP
ncbi:hypothetical protein LRS04_15590 [Phenylobacterium sp. J367]|nr:hypothetical protein [Phenylobacterium sp. J367]